MEKQSITIGLMARNIGNIVDTSILRTKRLSSLFQSANIVWLENGSEDDTRDKIIQYCYKNNNSVLLGHHTFDTNATLNLKNIATLDELSFQSDKSFNRCYRMAYARNILRDNMLRYDTDIYCIYDSDILGGFSYEGIANSFSYNWDFCCSNSIIYVDRRRLFYDSWAWRDVGHPSMHEDEKINLRSYEKGQPPLDIMSGFGGLGFYNNKFFPKSKYRYNSTDCDHPTINIPMYQDGAKLIMNPSQIVLYSKTRYVV